MISAFVGSVVEIGEFVIIQDEQSKLPIKCIIEGEIKVGDTGVFVGENKGDYVKVSRTEIRQFLDPLYEDELIKAAGLFTLIEPIDNPFPDVFNYEE